MTRGHLNLKFKFRTEHIDQGHYEHLYQTREELKEAEERNEGRVNWSVWDRVVAETKEQLKKMTELPATKERQYKKVYVYNYDGQLIAQYKSADEASERLNINKGTIQYSCTQFKPFQKERLYFSYTPMDYQDVRKITDNYKHKKPTNQGGGHKKVEKWVYDSSSMKLLGHFKDTLEVAQKFNVRPDAVNYYAWMNKPYKKKGLIFRNTPMEYGKEETERN